MDDGHDALLSTADNNEAALIQEFIRVPGWLVKVCDEETPAYNHNPGCVINYCPEFLEELESHSVKVKQIGDDPSGLMKENVRNLRSQATTALHEWLHIKNAPAECCRGGCNSTAQMINGGIESVYTYKAGRAISLANRDPFRAAWTTTTTLTSPCRCGWNSVWACIPDISACATQSY